MESSEEIARECHKMVLVGDYSPTTELWMCSQNCGELWEVESAEQGPPKSVKFLWHIRGVCHTFGYEFKPEEDLILSISPPTISAKAEEGET